MAQVKMIDNLITKQAIIKLYISSLRDKFYKSTCISSKTSNIARKPFALTFETITKESFKT